MSVVLILCKGNEFWQQKELYVKRKVYICIIKRGLMVRRMLARHIIVLVFSAVCGIFVLSCTSRCKDKETADAVVAKPRLADAQKRTKEPVLISNEQLMKENAYNVRADGLFDDFLFNYVNDIELQSQRTHFPLEITMANGEKFILEQDEWRETFDFMKGDYTTNLYSNEQEMSLNEDTTLLTASLEKIDLQTRAITCYDFVRVGGLWNLHSIRMCDFNQSDLNSFLTFYSRFVSDSIYQQNSMPRSIRVSIHDTDDENQAIEGFINKEQWGALNSGIPCGVITNIRYGQSFKATRKIWMEKISMGNGMSETFIFSRRGRNWMLEGYEN
jgi:hypothetical protein